MMAKSARDEVLVVMALLLLLLLLLLLRLLTQMPRERSAEQEEKGVHDPGRNPKQRGGRSRALRCADLYTRVHGKVAT